MIRPLVGLLCIGMALVCGRASQADENFRPNVAEAAKKLTAVMKAIRAQTITPLGVEDRTTFGATVLAGLEQMLTEELKNAGAAVREAGGSVGVKLVLSAPLADPDFEGAPRDRVLRLAFQLFDEFGEPVDTLNLELPHPTKIPDAQLPPFRVEKGRIAEDLRDPASALSAFGASADLNQGALDPFDAIRDTLAQPTASIASDGATAKPSVSSPFGVRIISGGKPKKLRMVDGQPFVDFESGEKFTLELENNASYDSNSTIMLDGINSFRFSRLRKSDGTPRYTSWNLKKRKVYSIAGWHLDNSTAQEFLATSYEQSKLRELGLDKTPIGAVTVVFRSSWEKPKDGSEPVPPEGEYDYLIRTPLADGRVEYRRETRTPTKIVTIFIGGGDEVAQHAKEGPSREIGRIRGVVTIRYRHPLVK